MVRPATTVLTEGTCLEVLGEGQANMIYSLIKQNPAAGCGASCMPGLYLKQGRPRWLEFKPVPEKTYESARAPRPGAEPRSKAGQDQETGIDQGDTATGGKFRLLCHGLRRRLRPVWLPVAPGLFSGSETTVIGLIKIPIPLLDSRAVPGPVRTGQHTANYLKKWSKVHFASVFERVLISHGRDLG